MKQRRAGFAETLICLVSGLDAGRAHCRWYHGLDPIRVWITEDGWEEDHGIQGYAI